MISRTRLYHADPDNPGHAAEQAVVDRLDAWQKANPGVIIMGMQWYVWPEIAVCEVTFETLNTPEPA